MHTSVKYHSHGRLPFKMIMELRYLVLGRVDMGRLDWYPAGVAYLRTEVRGDFDIHGTKYF